MYLPYRQFPRAARCRRDCSPIFLLKNSAPKLLCLGAILSLVCAANSSHSDNASITPRDRGVGDFQPRERFVRASDANYDRRTKVQD